MEENKNNVIDTGTEEIDEQIYYQVLNKIKETKINHSNNDNPNIIKLFKFFLEENADLSVEETFSVQNLKKYKLFLQDVEENSSEEMSLSESMKYGMYIYRLSLFDAVLKEVYQTCNDGSDLKVQIDSIKAVIPDKTLLDNTKVSKSMKKIVTSNRNIPMTVNVGNKKNNNECFVFVDIEDNNDIAISGGKFTAIDQANLRAIEDLFMAGNKYFTADMIYRARKGYTNAGGVSPQAIASVQNSINKMSNIRITIDYTNQYKLWYPEKDFSKSQFKKTEALLPLGIATVKVSGVEKTAYYLLKEPLLYEYAKTFKQVITLPSNLLNTKDVICRSSGDEDDVIVQYLLTRISIMKNKKNNTGNKIAYRFFDESKGKNGEYTGIFVEVGFKDVEPSANKARKLRDRTKDILTSFKNKGFIKGFKEYKQKDKKTYAGIEIFY